MTEPTNNVEVSVFPNPASNAFTIKYVKVGAFQHATLIDMLGRKLEQQELNVGQQEIFWEAAHLPNRIYTLQLDGKENVKRLKLIISK